jgi:hypothetical protein
MNPEAARLSLAALVGSLVYAAASARQRHRGVLMSPWLAPAAVAAAVAAMCAFGKAARLAAHVY